VGQTVVMEKISVLIPVYNVEKYLRGCLNSVINQSYKNIEIICVNDGSTDSSLDILKSVAKEDSRIKIFSYQNHGIGYTRNYLLKKARCNLLIFIDSDDYIDPDYIEKLFSVKNQYNTKISACKIRKSAPKKINLTYNRPIILNTEDSLKALMYMKLTPTGLSCKLFDKKLFDSLHFPNGIKYSDDFYMTWRLFARSDQVSFIDYAGYNYTYNNSSITKNKKISSDRLISLKYAEEELSFIKNKYPRIEHVAKNRLALEAIVILRQVDKKTNPTIYNICKQTILQNRKSLILDKNIYKKTRAIMLLSFIFGFNRLYRFFNKK
jgi:glycosyltransferase involved in cell wall biosynthesis